MLKIAYNISSDEQDSHHDNISVSVFVYMNFNVRDLCDHGDSDVNIDEVLAAVTNAGATELKRFILSVHLGLYILTALCHVTP